MKWKFWKTHMLLLPTWPFCSTWIRFKMSATSSFLITGKSPCCECMNLSIPQSTCKSVYFWIAANIVIIAILIQKMINYSTYFEFFGFFAKIVFMTLRCAIRLCPNSKIFVTLEPVDDIIIIIVLHRAKRFKILQMLKLYRGSSTQDSIKHLVTTVERRWSL